MVYLQPPFAAYAQLCFNRDEGKLYTLMIKGSRKRQYSMLNKLKDDVASLDSASSTDVSSSTWSPESLFSSSNGDSCASGASPPVQAILGLDENLGY
jgi:hypothetical protein